MLQHHTRTHRLRAATLAVVVAALAVTACSGGEDGNGGSAAPMSTAAVAAERPSSPAKLTIEQPRQGQTVKQARPELVLNLDGAKVVTRPSPASRATRATSTSTSTASSSP